MIIVLPLTKREIILRFGNDTDHCQIVSMLRGPDEQGSYYPKRYGTALIRGMIKDWKYGDIKFMPVTSMGYNDPAEIAKELNETQGHYAGHAYAAFEAILKECSVGSDLEKAEYNMINSLKALWRSIHYHDRDDKISAKLRYVMTTHSAGLEESNKVIRNERRKIST